MAVARYWRLVGVRPYGGGDLELGALHWFGASGRIDAAATLSCSHAPISGTLSALQDSDSATTARFAAAAVRSGGFYLRWDFATPVELSYPRLTAAGRAEFLGWATLQYSTDGATWESDLSFGRVIFPGPGGTTPADPRFRREATSQWDAASRGAAAQIDGRSAQVGSGTAGAVRTDVARTTGRRVFGLRLVGIAAPQTFFGGLAALSGWGPYNTGKHWLSYGYDNSLYYYPSGTRIALSPEVGAPQVPGDVVYMDVNLDTGYCAVRKNAGPWSAPVLLPNFVLGADYVIDLQAPSSSSNVVVAELLTTADELAGVLPAGTSAWDSAQGAEPFADDYRFAPRANSAICAASAAVPAHTAAMAHGLQLARDVEFGGAGRIWGTTKTKGTPNTPTKARVVLLHQRSKLPVRETWSDEATGAFEFASIDTRQEFLVLAEDVAGNFRPVAASRLAPEVTP